MAPYRAWPQARRSPRAPVKLMDACLGLATAAVAGIRGQAEDSEVVHKRYPMPSLAILKAKFILSNILFYSLSAGGVLDAWVEL